MATARKQDKYPVSSQWAAFRKRVQALGAYGLDASGPSLPEVGSRVCTQCLSMSRAGDWIGRHFLPIPHTYRTGCDKAPATVEAA